MTRSSWRLRFIILIWELSPKNCIHIISKHHFTSKNDPGKSVLKRAIICYFIRNHYYLLNKRPCHDCRSRSHIFLTNELILSITIIIIPMTIPSRPESNTVLIIPSIVRIVMAPGRVHPWSPISPAKVSLIKPVMASYPGRSSTRQIVGESALIRRMYGGQCSSPIITSDTGVQPGILNRLWKKNGKLYIPVFGIVYNSGHHV